jgi:hypothetical protein
MYSLLELKNLLINRDIWTDKDTKRHQEILQGLGRVSKKYSIDLPSHWK